MANLWERFDELSKKSNAEYENYEQNFFKVLNTCAPKKVKILREIINLIITKTLERLSWKGQGWKTRLINQRILLILPVTKKQRNLVVSLNRQAKSEYFNEV